MSRIGKRPVVVPSSVQVEIKDHHVVVKGPKGVLSRDFRPEVNIERDGDQLLVTRINDEKASCSLHGLSRTLLFNMVEGVTNGFSKQLELVGVGYRAQMQGRKLVLAMGYSHPVEMDPPEGIDIAVEGTTKVKVMGMDKQLVGDIAADIRAVRPPEPYKGKGIKYAGEKIRRKAGKAGGKKK
jgi:large subunit ribosomal protein L6